MNTPQKSQNELDKRESNLKLLKGQIRDIAQNLKITLHKDKDRSSTKKGNFAELLAESDELFAKRAIVFDIESFTKKIGGLDEMVIQLNCKYGLQDKIQNLNSFLDFCAIHGFIPMIDKILIEGKDVSAIKELYSLFFFALFERDWLISNMMANEIEKLEKSTQKPAREILNHISKITEYTSKTYQDLLGKGAEKLKNPGVISENVFAEVALRIENEVRDKVGIESSYIKLANYADDTQKKTDMNFVIKRTPKHNYTVVPTQFTIAANGGLRGKKEDVENFLFSQLKKGVPMRDSFLLLAVNGKFKSAFASSKVGEGAVKEYADWLDSTTEREKSW